MAYGDKFKLYFVDAQNNPRELTIQKKNYSGDVKDLVGTSDPVILKWDSDDDIYSPLRGSTCEINLFVTKDTDYDNWYEADEREYKVILGTGSALGDKTWDEIESIWAETRIVWDDNEGLGIESYWEGFLIVDRYSEAFTHKPYPIKLIASDGIGTLNGFDAPVSSVVNDAQGEPDPTVNQSNNDSLFHYLYKTLQLTGLDFDISIAHNIRKQDASDNYLDNFTIFHDISVNEFGLLGKNFKPMGAKDLLEKILRLVNARVFQSNSQWYVISNSNLIDARIYNSVPETEPLDPDDTEDVLEEDQDPTEVTIQCADANISTFKNEPIYFELDALDIDGEKDSLVFGFSASSDHGTIQYQSIALSDNTKLGYEVVYTPDQDFVGTDFFLFSASRSVANSATCRVNITVAEKEIIPTKTRNDLDININKAAYPFYGETIEQCVTAFKAINRIDVRLSNHFNDKFGLTTSAGTALGAGYTTPPDSFGRYTTPLDIQFSYGIGQADNSATNEGDHTWEFLPVGSRVAGYIYGIRDSRTNITNLDAYNPSTSNNTVDASWNTSSNLRVNFPREEQISNSVFEPLDGYYGFGLSVPYTQNNRFAVGDLTNRAELEDRGQYIPRYDNFNRRSVNDSLLSIRGLDALTDATYPSDLKALQQKNQYDSTSNVRTSILYIVKLVNGIVVERVLKPWRRY